MLVNYQEQPVLGLRGGGADQKRKEARKRKFAHLQSDEGTTSVAIQSRSEPNVHAEPVVKKRQTQASSSPGDVQLPPTLEAGKDGVNRINAETGSPQQKLQRFIVFIGNLPYTANDASITAHFAKLQPTSVRHRMNKETGKSKGFAFLEFAAYDRMKTCLKLYHHSTFDDGESPARKINVELTVGGGGAKSRDRKTKLQAKNWKLSEERKRRAEEEAKTANKASAKKRAERGKLRDRDDKKVNGHDEEPAVVDHGDIHPSRRSRMVER